MTEIVALRDIGKPRYFAEERRGQPVFQRRQILGVAVILVVGVKLGCINHAMLTAQAVRQAGLPLAGWNIGKPRYFAEERRGQPVFQRRQILGVALARRLHVTRSATISASIWISGRWIRRHPLRQQRFIQRHNIAEERRGQPVFQRRQILGVALARRLHVIGDPPRERQPCLAYRLGGKHRVIATPSIWRR
jgi:hypothetical protein